MAVTRTLSSRAKTRSRLGRSPPALARARVCRRNILAQYPARDRGTTRGRAGPASQPAERAGVARLAYRCVVAAGEALPDARLDDDQAEPQDRQGADLAAAVADRRNVGGPRRRPD